MPHTLCIFGAWITGTVKMSASMEGLERRLRVALAGDVMIGRGIDQAQAVSAPPELYEPSIRDARRYIDLAERANGPIQRPMSWTDPWGAVLTTLEELRPNHFFVNLETSLTADGRPWPDKGIHYRAHPENIGILSAAGVDCCSLANNHVLDFGQEGLAGTVRSLEEAGIAHTGAGLLGWEAERPVSPPRAPGKEGVPRIVGVAFGDSGIPDTWQASEERPGVFAFDEPSPRSLREISGILERDRGDAGAGGHTAATAAGGYMAGGARAAGADPTIVSIHWGKNWGFRIPRSHRDLARGLAETGLVSAVFGHSSHHPMAIEMHAGVPIIYGAGDLINDYEGIPGHEAYRPDLRLLYIIEFEDGRAVELQALALQARRFRLERADESDLDWLKDRLTDTARAPELKLNASGLLTSPITR